MSKNYEPRGNTTIICLNCTADPEDGGMWAHASQTTGELVGETDDTEVHEIECENCGNKGEYIRETTLGGGEQVSDGFQIGL